MRYSEMFLPTGREVPSDAELISHQLMIRAGLVRRLAGRDRRSKLITITPKGSHLLDEIWPHHVEAMERLAKAIHPQDTKVLAEILLRLRRVRRAG